MIVFRIVRFAKDANTNLDERAAGLRIGVSLRCAVGAAELLDRTARCADRTGDNAGFQVNVPNIRIKFLVERLEVRVTFIFKPGNYAGPVEPGPAIVAVLRV